MPTYEYLCQACSHRFDTWQKMTADPLQICPECGGHIRRVYYPAGIVFKGSGFYKTDHRSASATAEANGHHETKHNDGTNHSSDGANGTDGTNSTNSTNGTGTAASGESKSSGDSKTTAESHSSSKGSASSEKKATATTK